jgi:UDP-N-acetylglucosamine 2-epimerase (non-hydrolysing)
MILSIFGYFCRAAVRPEPDGARPAPHSRGEEIDMVETHQGRTARLKLLVGIGTRPEAIKMAPLVQQVDRYPGVVERRLVVTGQHLEMTGPVLELYSLKPDYDLALMHPDQSLSGLVARVLQAIRPILLSDRPDAVLVQGDTSSAMALALAAYHEGIPVGHVEAGLRTGNRLRPFPEEANRRIITQVARWNFAPTPEDAAALAPVVEARDRVLVVGNTGIDALLHAAARACSNPWLTRLLQSLGQAPVLLATAHRRESFGEPLQQICRALARIVELHPDVHIVLPVHPNPHVAGPVRQALAGRPRIVLTEPVDYHCFVHLLRRADLVLTDSGGIQEEAPALAKPLLVLRDETERPAGPRAGVGRLVGPHEAAIVSAVQELLADPEARRRMSRGPSLYGDGHAARRILRALLEEHHGRLPPEAASLADCTARFQPPAGAP